MDKLYIYSKVPCTVSVGDLLSRWPSECGAQDIKQHMRYNTNLDIACISMLGHPIDSITNRLNCNVLHHVMVVNPGYTVFKATETAEKSEVWNLASTDSYDLLSEVKGETASYSTVNVEPIVFANEQDAHSTVANDLLKMHKNKNNTKHFTKWYNNSHSIMDEFVCKSTLIPCSTCDTGMSGVKFDNNTIQLCRSCRPTERFKGTPIKVPKVLDISKLVVAQNTKKHERNCPVFTKRHMIDKEWVVFTRTEELPFIRGEEEMDDDYTSQFLERSTSIVYDIEIVTVDSSLKNSIPYEIVTITASFNVGNDMKDLVMFTRKLPEAWKTKVIENGETVDTTALLKDVRVEGATPLPRMKVVKCVGEKELVEQFRDYMLARRPHFFVSYNGEGFDHKFLIRASIANGSKETFRESFNHYTPLVKGTSSKDPTARTDPAEFMKRPAGKHCSGLIPDSIMKVDYETFPSMIGLDLYPIHSTTLDEACRLMGVNGGKMEGVSHADLPRLFYSADMDFFKYAALDVVITSELAVKDRFNSVELFMELEKLVCTPWNISASRKKTASAQCTTYVQFTLNGFLREAKLRPKTLLASVVLDEICSYFVEGTAPRLDETRQIITDFCNGHCKCNTLFKKLPKGFEEVPVTAKSAKKIISSQIKNRNKNKPFEYTTVDATMIVFFMTRGDIDWEPFRGLLDEFSNLTNDATNRRVEGLENFMKYLVQVRTIMSTAGQESAKLTWKEYKENHKIDTVVAVELKQFVYDRFEELLAASRQSKDLTKQIDVTAEELADIVRSVVGTIKLAMLSYDGALILCPNPTVDLNSLIGVLDFTSQYPYGMINMNLGLESHVSLDVMMACIRQIMDNNESMTAVEAARVLEQHHVNVCFTRRVDDTADWTDYLTQPDYLRRNCVFYIRNRVSVQNHQFKNEIRSRVVDKFKAEDQNLPKEVRKKHKNISNAKKVNINSRYGVIQSVINPLFQPTVTGVGRRSIKWVVKELERLIGAKEVYGDSVPGYTPLVLKDTKNGRTIVTTFSDVLTDDTWCVREDGKEELLVGGTYQIQTHDGWHNVQRLIRHKTKKKIYRVVTISGVVDVTEDHSLLTDTLDKIKPQDVVPGQTRLSHVVDRHGGCNGVCRGYRHFGSQYEAQKHFISLKNLGFHVEVEECCDCYRLIVWSFDNRNKNNNLVKSVRMVCDNYTDYVYDVETNVGSFNAGVGGIVLKNTDSCFTYIEGLDVFEMAKASPEWIYERLRFAQFDVSYEQFKETIYDKYFPVDMSQPRCIRHACGRVVHELYTLIAPRLSTNALELEPEKTLCGITVKQKKYTAYNCCTQSTLTKGMSIHNKAAFPLTATILKKYNELTLNCWTQWDLARDLYNYIGKEITGPIERGEIDPKLIAKPSSFDMTKLVENSKKMNLIKSLQRSGVDFPYEKVRVLQVTILPEGDDKDWSLCDIKNQSCRDKIHVVKVKFDVLNEIMGCLEMLYKAGVCETFQALMWGEFYPDRHTAEDFERMDADKPEPFKAMSFVAVNKRYVNGPPVPKVKKQTVSKRKSSNERTDAVKKQRTENNTSSIKRFFNSIDKDNTVSSSLSTRQSQQKTTTKRQQTLWDVMKHQVSSSTSDGALDKDQSSSSSTACWSSWVKQTR